MYKSALFHLHSILEGSPATMSGYCYEASRFGIDVVWISDHDSKHFRAGAFDAALDGPYRFQEIGSPDSASVRRSERPEPSLALRVANAGQEWGGAGLHLPYADARTRLPLIARPTATLRMRTDVRPRARNRRLVLRVHLGQAPPDHQPVFFDYGLGAPPEGESVRLPLPLEDGTARINLLDDLERSGWTADHMPQSFELRIEARKGASARAEVQGLSVQAEISSPEDFSAAQRELAEALGRQYGVTVLVGHEASAAEGHMTCFGPPLPMLFTPERRPARWEVSRQMEEAGGAVSINHPFSSWKREELSDERKAEIVRDTARSLLKNRAFGAHAVEVGFPEGRHGFEAEHYLELLDILSNGGLRLAGIGVSDAHRNFSWEAGNNFANYIASPDCDPLRLAAGIRKGDLYMADPARVKGPLSLRTDEGKSMGDVQGRGHLLFEIEGVPRGCELRWIADGHCVQKETSADGHKSQLDLAGAKRFVRAELHDAYGRLLLATNPVWTA